MLNGKKLVPSMVDELEENSDLANFVSTYDMKDAVINYEDNKII